MWMRTGFAITFAWLLSAAAFAQQYPNRPIRLIVPSAPGGTPDIAARMYAQEIIRQMGQQVIVDNRAGASGSIGMELVARAAPDGYTIGYGVFTLATNPAMLPKLRYDA